MNHAALAHLRTPPPHASVGGAGDTFAVGAGLLLLGLVSVPAGFLGALYFAAKDEGRNALLSAGAGFLPLAGAAGAFWYGSKQAGSAIVSPPSATVVNPPIESSQTKDVPAAPAAAPATAPTSST